MSGTSDFLGPPLPELPVGEAADALRAALAQSGAAVLAAPPGSGKTTLVPLILLAAEWLAGRKIVMLEPRRLAARLAAARIAELLGERLGNTVGYRVRFDAKVSPYTRIEVVTEGILVRRLQRDPELSDTGLVIFDEVHERNLDTDLGLAFVLDARGALRPDLRVLAMSATLDADRLARRLGADGAPAPIVTAEGRAYPVEVRYRPGSARTDLTEVEAAVTQALGEQTGDLLVFLPGVREIAQVARGLGERLARPIADRQVVVLPLHAQLERKAQDATLRPRTDCRRVILATNIAESSLTIEGISVVVDSGLERVPRFHPASGLSRLETVRISRASATQRAGRAGRLGPGVCYRLWPESAHPRLAAVSPPEIAAADLSALVLEVAAWGVRDVATLPWIELPPPAHVEAAWNLLYSLGAVGRGRRITPLGRLMADAPAHPRLAKMLLVARVVGDRGDLALASDLAALVEGRSPLRRLGGPPETDLAVRRQALNAYRERSARADVEPRAAAELARAADVLARWARGLEVENFGADALGVMVEPGSRITAGVLLSAAYPDRIALRRAGRDARYRLTNGRGARLSPDDALMMAEGLVAAHLDAGQADGRITLAAELTRQDILSVHRGAVEEVERVAWDPRKGVVEAYREARLGVLVLRATPLDTPAVDAVLQAMLEGVSRLGLEALPWTAGARSLQGRSEALRRWTGDAQWPALDDGSLRQSIATWLAPYLAGMSRRQHLERLDMLAILRALLGWERERQLNEGAPSRICLPSGREVALDYPSEGPPVLSARLQEFFGLDVNPTVGFGQVPVQIQLLSPAGRPVQVTQDLGGFWRGSYAEVRREMRGRYPKHYWPEDPLSAVATTRVRPSQ